MVLAVVEEHIKCQAGEEATVVLMVATVSLLVQTLKLLVEPDKELLPASLAKVQVNSTQVAAAVVHIQA